MTPLDKQSEHHIPTQQDEARQPQQSGKSSLLIIAIAIIAFSCWQARDLFEIWQSDVYARLAPLCFALWLLAGLVSIISKRKDWKPEILNLSLAIIVTLIGVIGSLNILKQIGFGLALAGLIPFSAYKYIWVIGIPSWLPATGWLAATQLNLGPLWLRLPALMLSLVILIPLFGRRNSNEA
ncbi:hypothetical protein [Rubellicoccus peritrichatus]|uniref:Uncharacterized protein n=1 Tax=Rubellicoccus peritrichatus TaxID=3080537 RepID=A0AAQ3LCP6_9BACT|nr:hypothetical protein [Puniceicoccus sp. CR14]WOO42024.1 hypothetical protein RZN69_02915 [Puniceicoccus sp. CR14]